jgi:hypothetical protein
LTIAPSIGTRTMLRRVSEDVPVGAGCEAGVGVAHVRGSATTSATSPKSF